MSALADLRGFAPNRRAAPDFAPNLERVKSRRDAAGPLGLSLVPAEARGLDALEQAFATMIGERAQALTVLSDVVLFNCLLTRRCPLIGEERKFAARCKSDANDPLRTSLLQKGTLSRYASYNP
jgi:hypothetical protein